MARKPGARKPGARKPGARKPGARKPGARKPERLGDGPLEARYRVQMQGLAAAIDGYLNEGATGEDRTVGFVLLVFEFGEPEGRCNFISNGANRRDIVTLFKEMIARFEGQPEMEGHA